jgi:hypothetical protein
LLYTFTERGPSNKESVNGKLRERETLVTLDGPVISIHSNQLPIYDPNEDEVAVEMLTKDVIMAAVYDGTRLLVCVYR